MKTNDADSVTKNMTEDLKTETHIVHKKKIKIKYGRNINSIYLYSLCITYLCVCIIYEV